MTELLSLELRKQRMAFLGVAGVFAGSFPLAVVCARSLKQPLEQTLGGAIVFWLFLGLALAAAVLGGSAGTGLRAQAEAEALLPASAEERAKSAVAAAWAYLAALALLVILASFVQGMGWKLLEPDSASGSNGLVWANAAIFSFADALICLASFVCAYGLAHGAAGGILGAAIGAAAAAGVGLGLLTSLVLGVPMGFSRQAVVIAAAAMAAGVWGMLKLARSIERQRKGWAWAAAALSLLCGPALSFGSAASHFRKAMSLRMLDYDLAAGTRGSEATPPSALRLEHEGVLLSTRRGDVLWISPDGTSRNLILGEDRSLKDILNSPLWSWQEHAWDADGRLWVLKREYSTATCDIYRGRPRDGLTLFHKLPLKQCPSGLVQRGREMGLRGWNPLQGTWSYASIPERGEKFHWTLETDDHGLSSLEALHRQGLAAKLDKNGRTLRLGPAGGGRRWQLPGAAVIGKPGSEYVPAIATESGLIFARAVALSSGRRALAVCRPDGTVRLAWEGSGADSYSVSALPDGSRAGWRDTRTLLRMTAAGEFLPPLDVGPAVDELLKRMPLAPDFSKIVRFDRESVWLLSGDQWLIRLSGRDGRVLDRWALPDTSAMWKRHLPAVHLGIDGLFVHTGARLFFIGFDGSRRSLSVR
ncbi:MAG: hypothetical protein NTX64_18805 [Elusimicrobia bacterium]|nr:hypothetical protein [Elusimicrobiota bacterium]